MMPKAAMNTRSSRSELVDDEAMDIGELTHVARRESIVRDFNTLRTRCTKVFRERANGFADNCESLIARLTASGNQLAKITAFEAALSNSRCFRLLVLRHCELDSRQALLTHAALQPHLLLPSNRASTVRRYRIASHGAYDLPITAFDQSVPYDVTD